MKLRIRGNSIRLRLAQTDLAALLERGAVEDCVVFPAGQSLAYRLESSAGQDAEALFDASRIVVRFPIARIRALARPEEVTLQAEQPLGSGECLKLLVEKDFQCLSPRGDENDADLFPNPSAS